jgi:DNA-directed RNA polymerase subunit beta'
MYILSEVQKVYRSQGVNINDKHFEVIIRKMLGKMQVVDPGDTDLLPGDLVDRLALQEINRRAIAEGKQPAKARAVLLGVTKAALATDSFLSAASFQHTIRVLAKAAVEGQKDMLYGLKENVIIGKLIPAGTGYRGDSPDSDGPIPSYEGVPLRPAVLPALPQPFLAAKEKGPEEELAALEEELELEKLMVGEESEDLLTVTTDLLDEDEEYGYEDVEEDEGYEEDDLMD